MVSRLLDAGCDRPCPFYVAHGGYDMFDNVMCILLNHPKCSLAYELDTVRSNWGATVIMLANSRSPMISESWYQEYGKIIRKYQFNLNAQFSNGRYRSLLNYVVFDAIRGFRVFRGIDPQRICTALLRAGADPCAVAWYEWPITVPVLALGNGSSNLSTWFGALASANVNARNVARHAYQSIQGSEKLIKAAKLVRKNFFISKFGLRVLDTFGDQQAFDRLILEEFADAGIYPDQTW